MKESTRRLWSEQDDRHPGNRRRLFTAVAEAFPIASALYPGSFVDIAPSFVIPSVTYVDTDRRAAAFFADHQGVEEIIARHRLHDLEPEWRFFHADYTSELELAAGSYDLLVSLYAGFVSAACTRYLAPGGLLLVNPSHGDAALAALDPRYELVAVVQSRSGDYAISTRALDGYLVPKKPAVVDVEDIRRTGRGIAYIKSPYAYVFRLAQQPTTDEDAGDG